MECSLIAHHHDLGARNSSQKLSVAFRSPISGIFLVDKPQGLSSAQVVARVKGLFDIRPRKSFRVGHAGTLDPNATGLLVVLVGAATRFAQFAEAGEKQYEIEILLGRRTSTDDIWGDTTSENLVQPTQSQVHQALQSFVGAISQTPPQISAIKVDGERAYRRARQGETVSLDAREVSVYSIDQVTVELPYIRASVRCSKGTYMRSLARDVGELLGCGGCLSAIRRTQSSPFTVALARPLELLTVGDLLPWAKLFPQAQDLTLDDSHAEAIAQGRLDGLRLLPDPRNAPSGSPETVFAVYRRRSDGEALGLLKSDYSGWTIAANVGRANVRQFNSDSSAESTEVHSTAKLTIGEE
jgi:tRNA pseudouridine55 synthase